jgi:hypothetical protein
MRRIIMKFLGTVTIWMPLLGLGAVLALAPQSRAQSEVAPDHFDAPDSRAVATAQAAAPKANQPPAPSTQVRNQKHSAPATLQIASAKSLSESQRPDVIAIQDKRKTATRKSNDR